MTDPATTGTSRARLSVGRRLAWLGALVSLVVLIVSGYFLARRIADYNASLDRKIYYFIEGDKTEFTFRGKPVTITDELNDNGEGHVIVRYADDTLRLPVQVPNRFPLPGLKRHADWLRVQLFADGTGLTHEQFEQGVNSGQIPTRLVIVTRNPLSEEVREGRFDLEPADSWGWGEVRRDRWTFTFHELLPEGGFKSHTLRFPESGASFYRRQVKADLAGEPPPKRRDDELAEGTWEYQAALRLMNRRPGITTEQQGLRNAGWTLPAASASMILLMVCLAFALAPSREPSQANPARDDA